MGDIDEGRMHPLWIIKLKEMGYCSIDKIIHFIQNGGDFGPLCTMLGWFFLSFFFAYTLIDLAGPCWGKRTSSLTTEFCEEKNPHHLYILQLLKMNDENKIF